VSAVKDTRVLARRPPRQGRSTAEVRIVTSQVTTHRAARRIFTSAQPAHDAQKWNQSRSFNVNFNRAIGKKHHRMASRLAVAAAACCSVVAASAGAAAAAAAAWRPISPFAIQPTEPNYEAAWQAKLTSLLGAQQPWTVPGGLPGAQCADSYADLDQGKYVWPALLAEMWKVHGNATALAEFATRNTTSATELGANGLFATQKCGTFFKPFNDPGLVTYLAEFGRARGGRPPVVPPSQVAAFTAMLWSSGWALGRRLEGLQDPIYAYGEFDSENYNWMSRASVLLAAEMVGNPYVAADGYAWLANLVRALYNKGRLEYDSTVYALYVLQPMLMLYEYSRNETARAQARAAADWLVAAHSLKMLDGWQVGPDARAKAEAAEPFFGSSWAMHYLLAVTPTAVDPAGWHPSYTDEDAAAHWAVDFNGQLPFTSYRPHQALVNLARRNYSVPVTLRSAKPFYRLNAGGYAHWAASDPAPAGRRFEYETFHADAAFMLSSLAAGRPDGSYSFAVPGVYGASQLPFSEQSVWRLGVLGGGGGGSGALPGAQQVFGNAGGGWFDTPAGRCPWEQLGQAGPVLLRVLSGAGSAWVALPNATAVTWAPLQHAGAGSPPGAFADMGHGVFFALLPFGAAGNATAGPYPHDPAWAQLTWPFSNASLGGLALEVGTAAAYASFGQFVAAVAATARFQLLDDRTPQLAAAGWRAAVTGAADADDGGASVGGGTLAYLAAGGVNLTVGHTGVGAYTMVNGDVVSPAGLQPNVWIDGAAVDFDAFDSFGGAPGSAIPPPLAQAWGSGVLEVTAGGSALRIAVDPATGAVEYFER
jgi:hypothetical protein